MTPIMTQNRYGVCMTVLPHTKHGGLTRRQGEAVTGVYFYNPYNQIAWYADWPESSKGVCLHNDLNFCVWVQTPAFSAAFLALNSCIQAGAFAFGSTKIFTTSSTTSMLPLLRAFSNVTFRPTLMSPPVIVSM
jgi:hypothetical protein